MSRQFTTSLTFDNRRRRGRYGGKVGSRGRFWVLFCFFVFFAFLCPFISKINSHCRICLFMKFNLSSKTHLMIMAIVPCYRKCEYCSFLLAVHILYMSFIQYPFQFAVIFYFASFSIILKELQPLSCCHHIGSQALKTHQNIQIKEEFWHNRLPKQLLVQTNLSFRYLSNSAKYFLAQQYLFYLTRYNKNVPSLFAGTKSLQRVSTDANKFTRNETAIRLLIPLAELPCRCKNCPA